MFHRDGWMYLPILAIPGYEFKETLETGAAAAAQVDIPM